MQINIAQPKAYQNMPAKENSAPPKNRADAVSKEFNPMKWAKWIMLILGLSAAVGVPIYMAIFPYKVGDDFSRLIGIIGSAMMFVGASFYVIRKKVRRLSHFGKIKDWLDIHILFCLFGPMLIVYHSGFTVTATNSAIAYYSMMIVVGSGIVGRYIYRHFQFSLSGERATLREMNEEISQLSEKIKTQFSDSQKTLDSINRFFGLRESKSSAGLLKSLYLMIKIDLLEKKVKKEVIKYLKERKYHVLEGSLEEMVIKLISLEKHVTVLESAAKLFSIWHKLHVPFIWILIVTFIIHIAAVMIF
ncbi:MAG: hypothetical protein HY200_01670 [Nitrospirae bacterium]|nr:hypothetical protein [Nitrospirota bacterium]